MLPLRVGGQSQGLRSASAVDAWLDAGRLTFDFSALSLKFGWMMSPVAMRGSSRALLQHQRPDRAKRQDSVKPQLFYLRLSPAAESEPVVMSGLLPNVPVRATVAQQDRRRDLEQGALQQTSSQRLRAVRSRAIRSAPVRICDALDRRGESVSYCEAPRLRHQKPL